MTDYPFDMQLVVDPLNPANVIQGGTVTLYDPADVGGVEPLAVTDPSGLPLPNPLTSNTHGFLPPFLAPLPQVMWKSGTYQGYFNSYVGLRDEAIGARTAAETAAETAGTEAAAVATAAIGDATADADAAAAAAAASATSAADAATSAANAADLVDAPADTAVQTLINSTGSATRTALNATYVGSDKVKITEVSGGWNFKAGHPNNVIAPDVLGSIIAGDGTLGRENVIGNGVIANVNTSSSNVPADPANLLHADPNTRANHCFVAGYDNVAAGLKSVILADHAYIKNGASHNTISGGAVHGVDIGDFCTIGGGYQNFIRDGDYVTIAGGWSNEVNVPGGGNVTVAGGDNTVTGSAGTVFGVANSVSGTGGFAVGASNSVTGAYGSAIGQANTVATGSAAGTNNTVAGANARASGNLNTASGAYAYAHGNNNQAVGTAAVAEGVQNVATPNYSSARGLQAVTTSVGQHSIANGAFAVAGDAQTSTLIQKITTTTAAEAFFGNSYAIPASQSAQYRVLVTARDVATGDTKTWRLEGAAKRIGTAGAVAVGGSYPAATVVAADAGAAAWACRMGGSGNSIVLFGTGEASKTLHWVARTELVEVG